MNKSDLSRNKYMLKGQKGYDWWWHSFNGKKRHNKLWNGETGKGIIQLYKKREVKKFLLIH